MSAVRWKAPVAKRPKFVKGNLTALTIRHIEMNPAITEADLKLAVPAGTRIAKFEGRRRIDHVVAAMPVDDLSSVADDLQSLTRAAVAARASESNYSETVVVLAALVLVALIVLIVATQRRTARSKLHRTSGE